MHTTTTRPIEGGWARSSTSKRPLDRILGLFADVQAGEGASALLLMANVFLLLAAYYLVWLVLAIAIGRHFHRLADAKPAA